jgi:hypothetical protein
MEFYGAHNIQPFFTIRKSLTLNQFLRTFLHERKMASTVILCDNLWLVLFFPVTRCDFSYLAMNCDYIWHTTTYLYTLGTG